MFVVAVFAFLATACSGNSDGVKIEGRLLNMNQADFFLYSPDGAIPTIDTIHVMGGRFVYENRNVKEGTLVIVFPNFKTIPVFVEPGASIDIKGDAAHLSATKITGTKDNKLFTEWRELAEKMSPPELRTHAEHFIHDHPEAAAATWLVTQQFIACPKPNYKKARSLLNEIKKHNNNVARVTQLLTALDKVGQFGIGDRLPSFTTRDINGQSVSSASLLNGSTAILLWSSWNYESQNMLRQLASNQRLSDDPKKLDHVLTICIDADIEVCRRTLRNNNANELITVCDGQMWDSPLLRLMALSNIPDNIRLQNGKVTGRSMPIHSLTRN